MGHSAGSQKEELMNWDEEHRSQQAATGVRARLRQHARRQVQAGQAGQRRGVVQGKVQAGADADLEHVAGRAPQQRTPQARQAQRLQSG